MDMDELCRITRRAYLLVLALAGLEAQAEHSSPAGPPRHYEPVRELADEIHAALADIAATARETRLEIR